MRQNTNQKLNHNKIYNLKSKGYSDYNKYFPIGWFYSLSIPNVENKIKKILNNLDESEILTVIPTLLYKDENSMQRAYSLKSMKLNNKTNITFFF